MSNHSNFKNDSSKRLVYQIRISGHLGPQWMDWFDGLSITPVENGDTILTGAVAEQAALYGLLKKIRDLGMTLLSISSVETDCLTTFGTGQADQSDVKN